MKRFFDRGSSDAEREASSMAIEVARGRLLIEESREIVVVLDGEGRVISASRRARETLPELEEGSPLPARLLAPARGRSPLEVAYEVDGRRETLVYFGEPGGQSAYEELRSGFTAAVSHELRTPLARLLALLDTALLPGSEPLTLIEKARSEVEQIRELIDEVLFISELETGRQPVSLGSTPVLSVVREVADTTADSASRAGIRIEIDGDERAAAPIRPRMLRVVVENLTANAIRYAGHGATLTLTVRQENGAVVLQAADDGVGVGDEDLPRLFERFYRADRARTSRGTGLGLAIVKHIVTAAGGAVDAGRPPTGGLEIRCTFPAP